MAPSNHSGTLEKIGSWAPFICISSVVIADFEKVRICPVETVWPSVPLSLHALRQMSKAMLGSNISLKSLSLGSHYTTETWCS